MTHGRLTSLDHYGGGVDHGRHVSLMDCMAAVRAAGIEAPPLPDPVRAWREFEAERDQRVFRTSLYAVRRACPDAPAVPPAEPPERDYAWEAKQRTEQDDGAEQATLDCVAGGEA